MSESGVIPPPEERQHSMRPVGHLFDMDGRGIEFWVRPSGVVYFTIPAGVSAIYLDKAAREEFSRLYFEAARQAETPTARTCPGEMGLVCFREYGHDGAHHSRQAQATMPP